MVERDTGIGEKPGEEVVLPAGAEGYEVGKRWILVARLRLAVETAPGPAVWAAQRGESKAGQSEPPSKFSEVVAVRLF